MRSWMGAGMAALAVGCGGAAHAETLRLTSPNGQVAVSFSDDAGAASYAVSLRGRTLISPSAMGLQLDKGGRIGGAVRIGGSQRTSVDRTYRLVAGKVSEARDHFNEMTVDLAETGAGGRRMQIVLRAYDDGIAFRYRLPVQAGLEAVNVQWESTQFAFGGDFDCWGLNLGHARTSHEGEFDKVSATRLRATALYDAPLVCETKGAAFALAEADLKDWSAMYLSGRGDGGPGVEAKLSPRLDDPGVAVRTRIGSDVVSPWRVVMVGENAGQLVESTLITNLNPDPAFDASWVKPGKAAWDWWNGPQVSGVPKPGMNNETIRKFIDFAAEAKLEYMLVDEGWYAGAGGGGTVRPGVDMTRTIPEIDMPALVAYGRDKGVGLWVWANWQALDAQMDEALALYERWGVKGIKVDFMDRDDQEMVAFFHRLLRKAAEHHLLVNLHGMSHPTGMTRTYPHFLTQEGVLGAEYNKWSRRVTASHNVTLPFTRMLLGPMDYTPGGFRNVTPAAFEPRNTLPFVQTSRGQALAMYVVYESPFACVSDSPDAYVGQPELEVISAVPTTWDETRVLAGEIGQYVVVARRKGDSWWIGAMTNETGRTVRVPLERLKLGGAYAAELWTDGATPSQTQRTRRTVRGGSLSLKLAPSGGALVRLEPQA
ncbi:glycoside hydrolase family 97 protein [Phenylobacterium deserti]|uniref:Glycoside hydrolase family 97 protein n=1 Tax=Phenylobacterium deserti TaxID=1914756 RepID=A0A328A8I6_9CAUL|nr:glycoside hydrolase family 97 protein [Phenylobacterium deserti]RAK50943.1 glycoside hydrolase family 97 protein [Phenylobacterium deserti]